MCRPFFRKQTCSWYVWVGKELINLGKKKALLDRLLHLFRR